MKLNRKIGAGVLAVAVAVGLGAVAIPQASGTPLPVTQEVRANTTFCRVCAYKYYDPATNIYTCSWKLVVCTVV